MAENIIRIAGLALVPVGVALAIVICVVGWRVFVQERAVNLGGWTLGLEPIAGSDAIGGAIAAEPRLETLENKLARLQSTVNAIASAPDKSAIAAQEFEELAAKVLGLEAAVALLNEQIDTAPRLSGNSPAKGLTILDASVVAGAARQADLSLKALDAVEQLCSGEIGCLIRASETALNLEAKFNTLVVRYLCPPEDQERQARAYYGSTVRLRCD